MTPRLRARRIPGAPPARRPSSSGNRTLDGASGTLRLTLAALRARGGSVPVEDVARRLLALSGPVRTDVARRVVACALGREPSELPGCLAAAELRPAARFAEAHTALESAEFVVVDLETTGLSPERSVILEIGAVRVSRLRPLDAFATLVQPARPVPPAITQLTGIRDGMVATAPTLPEALGRFRAWLARSPTAPFVAHNAAFDASFLGRALADQGLPGIEVPVLCTRRLARRLLPELRRGGLDALTQRLGLVNTARHRALGDALVTAQALVEMVRLARATGAATTLGDLLALQGAASRRRRRRPARTTDVSPARPDASPSRADESPGDGATAESVRTRR